MQNFVWLILLLAASCKAPASVHPAGLAGQVAHAELPDDCMTIGDDTDTVQAYMTAGSCLPAGVYRIDMPALNSVGRRRDAMLSGGTLCGTRSDTTVLFRGDAHAMYWIGVMNADVHDIRLDSSCVTNTIEQTHLMRITESHTIQDAILVHPKRSTLAGDAMNVVGSTTQPIAGMVVDHVEFMSCARLGVQISRGVNGARISNSTFLDSCAFGSEGSGAINGLVIDHVTFSGLFGLGLNVQQQTNLTVSHVTLRGRTVLLYHCDHCRLDHVSVSDVPVGSVGDFISAITIADVAHDVRLSDVLLTQATNAATPVIAVGPLRPNRQADLSGIVIERSKLMQLTAAPIALVQGTAGFSIVQSTVTYAGPLVYDAHVVSAGPYVSVLPAVSVPTTDVIQSDNVLTGCSP